MRVLLLFTLLSITNLSAQSVSFGFTGCAGLAPPATKSNIQGDFEFDAKMGYFAQGGIFVEFQTKNNYSFRISEQGTATQYGFRVDFDPDLQPEVPINDYSVHRSWLTSRQIDFKIGIPVFLKEENLWRLTAGLGIRRILSAGISYSYVMGISPNQSVTCFRSRISQGGGNYLCGIVGVEREIRLLKKYAFLAGFEVQLAEQPEAFGTYEYFPARTVSYSSGNFTVSSLSFSFRLTAPVLWWKKKEK
jgi:hypothetical protein